MGLLGKIASMFGGSGGRALVELASRLGMTAADLRAVKPEYREFTIPKRDGSRRTISAPAPQLKKVQKLILRRVLGRLAADSAALGFERGASFVDHARLHAANAVIVRMDIRDFFPSTTQKSVSRYLKAIGWGPDAVAEVVRLCCRDGRLPQGAPTSPRLANLVNRQMDARLTGAAESHGAAYSRYADDIVFSFAKDEPHRVRGLVTLARFILRDAGYRLNRRKGPRVLRKHQRQTVTGLVVNGGPPRLPRKTLRWLRAVEHRAGGEARSGAAPTITAAQLRGWRALVSMVGPR